MYWLYRINGFIYFGLVCCFIFLGPNFLYAKTHNKKFNIIKNLIRHLESSNGTLINHKPIKSGIHKGHVAYGCMGLMLNTAKEIVKRKQRLNKVDNLDLEVLHIQNSDEFHKFMDINKHKYWEYVDYLINFIGHKSNWDPYIAAIMWRWGHNLTVEESQNLLQNNPVYKKRIDSILNP